MPAAVEGVVPGGASSPDAVLAGARGRAASNAEGDARAAYEAVKRLPRIAVELVRDLGSSAAGFLQVRQVELRNRYADGSESAPYRYFWVERRSLDAVAIVLYRRRADALELVLRSQLRPPLCFREQYEVPLLALGTGVVQWEIPAGLIEPGERGHAGLCARASAEAREEVGIVVPSERFALLGDPTSLSPGLIAEKLHFVCAEIVDSDPRERAQGDGHAVEEHSVSHFVPLDVAQRAIEEGWVHDIKTEVGIRRLAAAHAASASGAGCLPGRAERAGFPAETETLG